MTAPCLFARADLGITSADRRAVVIFVCMDAITGEERKRPGVTVQQKPREDGALCLSLISLARRFRFGRYIHLVRATVL